MRCSESAETHLLMRSARHIRPWPYPCIRTATQQVERTMHFTPYNSLGKLCEILNRGVRMTPRSRVRRTSSSCSILTSAEVVASKHQLAIAAEVDLDEMTYDGERRSYTWPCRCSSYFEIDEATLERGGELVSCYGCSSHIKVLYQTAD